MELGAQDRKHRNSTQKHNVERVHYIRISSGNLRKALLTSTACIVYHTKYQNETNPLELAFVCTRFPLIEHEKTARRARNLKEYDLGKSMCMCKYAVLIFDAAEFISFTHMLWYCALWIGVVVCILH